MQKISGASVIQRLQLNARSQSSVLPESASGVFAWETQGSGQGGRRAGAGSKGVCEVGRKGKAGGGGTCRDAQEEGSAWLRRTTASPGKIS